MSILSVAENDLIKAGSFLLGVSAKASKLFAAEKTVSPEAITVFNDVEALISLAAPAVGAEGINFAADSAAYAAFIKLVADAKVFAASEADVIKSL